MISKLFPIVTVLVCSTGITAGFGDCPEEFYDTGIGPEDCGDLCHPDSLDYVWDTSNCATLCPLTHQCLQTIAKTTAKTPVKLETTQAQPREGVETTGVPAETSTHTLSLVVSVVVGSAAFIIVTVGAVVVGIYVNKRRVSVSSSARDMESSSKGSESRNSGDSSASLIPKPSGVPPEDGNTASSVFIPSGTTLQNGGTPV